VKNTCGDFIMKVLALNGSPRKGGNTEILLEEMLTGVKEQGGEVKLYNLNTMRLTPCQDCGACDEKARCPIPDDMQAIYDELRTADRIIIASPIFFYNISAQMKAMIDRCQVFWAEKYLHKKPITPGPHGRKGLLLLVGGMKLTEKNEGFHCSEAVVRAFFRTVNVPEDVTLAYANVDKKGAIRNHPTALKDAFEAGRALVAR
jgi:NAD(P)H-dependent FMN reductase